MAGFLRGGGFCLVDIFHKGIITRRNSPWVNFPREKLTIGKREDFREKFPNRGDSTMTSRSIWNSIKQIFPNESILRSIFQVESSARNFLGGICSKDGIDRGQFPWERILCARRFPWRIIFWWEWGGG